MNILRRCVLIISDNKVFIKRVIYFHKEATQELINEKFDGLNLSKNGGNNYLDFACNRYNIVLIHCLNNIMQIVLPDNICEYQNKKLRELKEYISYLNKKDDNVMTILRYKKNYYYNMDNVFNLLRGEILERKRSKW